MSAIPEKQTALQFTEKGDASVLQANTSAPVPSPGPNQLLIKNTFAGINFIDTYFRSGLYPVTAIPCTLGGEAEGTVVAVGPDTTGFAVGDYVGYLGMAAQAEYTIADAAKTVIVPPEIAGKGLVAASLLQGLTALTFIREAYEVKKGDTVVVHAAAGGVGLWLLQLLRVVGAGKIIALASTPEKLALTKQFGATHTISSREDEWVERVKEIAVDGVEAVFDGVGRATFEGDLKVLKRKGSLVLFGNASGVVEPFQLNRLSEKNLKVMRPKVLGYLATDDEWKIYSDNLVKLLVEKKVEVRIHKTYSLAEAIQAHQDIEGRGTTGKLLFKL